MTDPEIMAWVTPPRHGLIFRCSTWKRFAAAAPRCTCCEFRSQPRRRSGGCLTPRCAPPSAAPSGSGTADPPLWSRSTRQDDPPDRLTCPDLEHSHLGSRGIIPVTILQSYEKGVTVWGEHGMAALWGAATKKLIGAGR